MSVTREGNGNEYICVINYTKGVTIQGSSSMCSMSDGNKLKTEYAPLSYYSINYRVKKHIQQIHQRILLATVYFAECTDSIYLHW